MNIIDNLQKEIKVAYRSLCNDNEENKIEPNPTLQNTHSCQTPRSELPVKEQRKFLNERETSVKDTLYSKTHTNISRTLVFKDWTNVASEGAPVSTTAVPHHQKPALSPTKSAAEFNRERLKQAGISKGRTTPLTGGPGASPKKVSTETIESQIPQTTSESRYLRELQQFREEHGDLCFGESRKLFKRRHRFRKGSADTNKGTHNSDDEVYEREYYDAGYFRVEPRLYIEKLEPPKVRFVFLDSDEPVHERPLTDGEDILSSDRVLGSPRSKILVDNGDAWGREIMDVKESKPVKISVPKSVIYPKKDKYHVPHRRRSFDPADSIQIGDYLHRAYQPWIPDKRIPASKSNDMSLRRRTGADRREETPEI